MWWLSGIQMAPPEYAVPPPNTPPFSSTTALIPRSRAMIAAVSPPALEPTATRSTSRSHLLGTMCMIIRRSSVVLFRPASTSALVCAACESNLLHCHPFPASLGLYYIAHTRRHPRQDI